MSWPALPARPNPICRAHCERWKAMAWSASNAASAGASRPRSCMTAWSWTCRLRWHAKQAEPWPLGREQAGPPPARQGWRVSRPRFAHDLAVARLPLSARLNDEPLVGRNKRSALRQCLTNCGRKPQRPLPRVRGRDREGAWNDTYRERVCARTLSPTLPRKRGREQTELAPRSRCDGDLLDTVGQFVGHVGRHALRLLRPTR